MGKAASRGVGLLSGLGFGSRKKRKGLQPGKHRLSIEPLEQRMLLSLTSGPEVGGAPVDTALQRLTLMANSHVASTITSLACRLGRSPGRPARCGRLHGRANGGAGRATDALLRGHRPATTRSRSLRRHTTAMPTRAIPSQSRSIRPFSPARAHWSSRSRATCRAAPWRSRAAARSSWRNRMPTATTSCSDSMPTAAWTPASHETARWLRTLTAAE